ncbi:hypothetical protein Plhal304r1_c018g0064391 [Plasmopara halstedii]
MKTTRAWLCSVVIEFSASADPAKQTLHIVLVLNVRQDSSLAAMSWVGSSRLLTRGHIKNRSMKNLLSLSRLRMEETQKSSGIDPCCWLVHSIVSS